MSTEEPELMTAHLLERQVLGGEPFYYLCGCFGVITSVHPNNHSWVQVQLRALGALCAPDAHDFAPLGYAGGGWHWRDGTRITLGEWDHPHAR